MKNLLSFLTDVNTALCVAVALQIIYTAAVGYTLGWLNGRLSK